jgi:flagellar assembly factor FliW
MMKINTTRFGEIRIDEEKIIHMPHGMLGFPDMRQYVLFPHKKESPFFWYQSVDNPGLAFVITSPFFLTADYHVDVEPILKEMDWHSPSSEHLELYVVVNIPRGSPEKMTANLIGPILINNEARQAVQLVISNSPYSHKHRLMEPQ